MQNLEGVLQRVMQSKPTLTGDNSSPCEGGGREGVAQTNSEVNDAHNQ